jgi:4-amino-4-deoxy-L-arabinose transferase-like glycosyltransferase
MTKKTLLILIAILLVATFFRVWRLDITPPALYPDVAINGVNALDTLKSLDFKIFYPDNNGREGLIMWMDALAFLIFGPSIWSLKITTAVIGILTVLGTYLLTKQLLKKISPKYEAIALLSSFLLAISFWHVNFSRIGFRAIMVPFFITFGLYYLLKGFESSPLRQGFAGQANLIISGIFFGLGFYTYISYRFVVFLLAVILFLYWKESKKQNTLTVFIKRTKYLLISTFIVALPIGLYFLFHIGDFFGRASGVSVLQQNNPLFALIKSVVVHLGMFNFYGDANWRHNYSGSPELFWPVGIIFIIGLIISVISVIKAYKSNNFPLFTAHFVILSWILILMMPGFLSGEGIPHALRVIGVIPPVYILAGIGGVWFYEKIKMFYVTKNQKIMFFSIISFLVLLLTYYELNRYFYDWGMRKEVYAEFNQNYVNMANYLNSLPDNVNKYVMANEGGVLVNNVSMPAQTIIFLERAKYGKTRATYLKPDEIDKISPTKGTIILIMKEDSDLFMKLLATFQKDLFYYSDGYWIMTLANDYTK